MGFERKQFTFYRSFYLAASQLPVKKRAEFVWALIEYALDEIEPSTKDVTIRSVFESVRPVLDKARTKAKAGKTGGQASSGASMEDGSKTEAKRKQTQANGSKTQAKKEGEIEKEIEIEVEGEGEKEGYASPPGQANRLFAEVFEVLRLWNVFMDDKDKAECRRLCEEYGTKAVIAAINRAKDQNVPRWSYIRAIVTSGGVGSQRKGRGHIIGHDDPPGPAAISAIRDMLDWDEKGPMD